MKRGIISTGILALIIGVTSQAQANRLGIHGGFSNGGDVEDSELGFGGQLELSINPFFNVELAMTQFSDEITGSSGTNMDQDVTSIGLSAVFRGPLGPQLEGFTLLGLNYNVFDMDLGEVDDGVGFHLGAGLNLPIAYNMEVFGEYRYTFLETEWETGVSGMDEDYEYNFGMAKVGLNFLF